MSGSQLMMTSLIEESLVVSRHSVALTADDGDDVMASGLIELCSSATSKLWIFALKLDASSGLNHRLLNCKLIVSINKTRILK
jgi:hypothetical protein